MSINKVHTQILSMHINKFRGLQNQNIQIGKNLTLISGRNGTGKSTILGLLAQICSFKTRYGLNRDNKIVKIEDLKEYRTVYGQPFYSEFRNHFKISDKYDLPESNYSVDFTVHDGDIQTDIAAELEGGKRTIRKGKTELRLVTRQKTKSGLESRNFTYPTIFLSLGRLTPFVSRKEKIDNSVFSTDELSLFKKYDRSIFNSPSHLGGVSSNNPDHGIPSSTVTGDDYDIQSASSGEDNIGQIISALISFARLSKEYSHYMGGLLLIDELDAALFPKVQSNIVSVLNHFSTKYNVQVVFTSHSPQIIRKVMDLRNQSMLNTSTKSNICFNYFNDDYLPVQVASNWSIVKVMSKLNVETPQQKNTKIQVFTEDYEAEIALRMIASTTQKKEYKVVNSKRPIGGDQLKTLALLKLPDFNSNSVVVLDGDKQIPKQKKNFITLPFDLPPDQFMYSLLANEVISRDFWNQSQDQWPRGEFLECDSTKKIMNDLTLENGIYVKKGDATNNSPVRDYFKNWFKANERHLRVQKTNPIFKIWMPNHGSIVSQFRSDFSGALGYVASHAKLTI